ncbi:hypothetical protein FB451DRAFT_1190736 [Mycena latifolia]|nr:hypothetical protein FB451DRAFT_1190736 [Mycena latifolia]
MTSERNETNETPKLLLGRAALQRRALNKSSSGDAMIVAGGKVWGAGRIGIPTVTVQYGIRLRVYTATRTAPYGPVAHFIRLRLAPYRAAVSGRISTAVYGTVRAVNAVKVRCIGRSRWASASRRLTMTHLGSTSLVVYISPSTRFILGALFSMITVSERENPELTRLYQIHWFPGSPWHKQRPHYPSRRYITINSFMQYASDLEATESSRKFGG